MTIVDRFHAMAAMRGWNADKQVAVLLDHIARHGDDTAFLDAVAQQDTTRR